MAERKKFKLVNYVGPRHAGWGYGCLAIGLLRAINEGVVPDLFTSAYLDEPSVFLQNYCDVLVDANYEECQKLNIPVVKVWTCAGGTNYVGPGATVSLWGWRIEDHPEIPTQLEIFNMKMLGAFADTISEKCKVPTRYRPLNDVEIWDPSMMVWRKFCLAGTVIIGEAQACIIEVTVLKREVDILGRVLKSPKDKFADKVAKDVYERTWSFEEAGGYKNKGVPSTDDIFKEWTDIYLEASKRAFGLETESEFVDFDKRWKVEEYAGEIWKQISSHNHIFSRSAEKRFETIPQGTALGKHSIKVPMGPLVRAYVLRRGDNIEELMLTGTMHMAPADTFEAIEKELKGVKVDESVIRAKVEDLFKKKNVMIALGDASLVADVVIKACKESYKGAKEQT